MCNKREDLGRIGRLEIIASIDLQDDIACTCRGVALWLRGNFENALLELEKAICIDPEIGGAYFWKAMAYASLRRDEEAREAFEKALTVDFPVPPILLKLINWLEQEKPDFYEQYGLSLIEKF